MWCSLSPCALGHLDIPWGCHYFLVSLWPFPLSFKRKDGNDLFLEVPRSFKICGYKFCRFLFILYNALSAWQPEWCFENNSLVLSLLCSAAALVSILTQSKSQRPYRGLPTPHALGPSASLTVHFISFPGLLYCCCWLFAISVTGKAHSCPRASPPPVPSVWNALSLDIGSLPHMFQVFTWVHFLIEAHSLENATCPISNSQTWATENKC